MTVESKNHHVAWADRVGLNKLWAKAIERIWATYGTSENSKAVWGLRTVLVNINNGPQLRKITDDYIKELNQDKYNKLEPYYDTYAYGSEKEILDEEMLGPLANFMIQLLEDNGFAFYESSYEEEEKMD